MRNYLTSDGGFSVKLCGFVHIGTEMSVSIPFSKKTLVLETIIRPEKENCFTVQVTDDRTVIDKRFFYLVDDFELLEKDFIYNAPSQNYICV